MSTAAAPARPPRMAAGRSPRAIRHAAILAGLMRAGYATNFDSWSESTGRQMIFLRVLACSGDVCNYITRSPIHRDDQQAKQPPKGDDHDHPTFHQTRRPCGRPDG